ncbi:hypothetical protein GCM10023205_18630 [Yinghuangia aomiensis]|uniref:RHS repeat-associated core domain-containing protein n=1 Tax=Yinghuangia aomiensis TaxID=676205 RepID=A0ABP9H0E9_9ACTN
MQRLEFVAQPAPRRGERDHGSSRSYRYDPLARRTEQAVTGPGIDGEAAAATRRCDWDGLRKVGMIDATGGSTTWDHLPGTWNILSQHVGPAVDEGESAAFTVAVTDRVGPVTALVERDGTTLWRAQRTLWGTDIGAGAPGGAHVFAGQTTTGDDPFAHSLHRNYDPELGVFLSPDPLGLAAAPNPHAYVDNPLAFSDPLGLSPYVPTHDRATLSRHLKHLRHRGDGDAR